MDRGNAVMGVRWARSLPAILLAVLVMLGGYFLWTEHEAHVVLAASYWPWLLLALCPLLHIFMHGGHGHGRSSEDRGPE